MEIYFNLGGVTTPYLVNGKLLRRRDWLSHFFKKHKKGDFLFTPM